jgi:hypothetical protein
MLSMRPGSLRSCITPSPKVTRGSEPAMILRREASQGRAGTDWLTMRWRA